MFSDRKNKKEERLLKDIDKTNMLISMHMNIKIKCDKQINCAARSL